MSKSLFSFLRQREILNILIGDTTIAQKDGYNIAMPQLTGSMLKSRMYRFGDACPLEGCSRWVLMDNLLEFAIANQRESDLLFYWFSREHFTSLRSLNDQCKIEAAHRDIVESVLSEINTHLFLSGNKLIKSSNRFMIIPVQSNPVFELPAVQNINVEYIRSLRERCADDIATGNYDSVITKSRTLIEEILIYILEKNNIEIAAKGEIKKLYAQFKTRYNMNTQKGFCERVNKLLSGLETILQAIAEMRNMNSDAHGVGQNRINIKKRDAQLVINSAMIFSEYLLETYENNL